MSDYVVGLTGGIGSGKSAAAAAFAALGAVVVDTDAIAHELTGPGGRAMPALVAAFGPEAAGADGSLDRARMRRAVFADPDARSRLEGILHPLIRSISAERCRQAASPYVILAVPLLVESGTYRDRCDRIAVVDCPEEVQMARVMARNGMGRDEVAAIMAAQATRAARLAVADDLIANEAGLAELHARVAALDGAYRVAAAEKTAAKR